MMKRVSDLVDCVADLVEEKEEEKKCEERVNGKRNKDDDG